MPRNAAPELTIVVPTFNERDNIRPMVALLNAALPGLNWEVLFVDDNSPDGTAREVRALARQDARVRLLHRIGRRGLAGACIEGMLSSIAPVIAVIDADLQHDETRLALMYDALQQDPELHLAIGSRNVADGSSGTGLSVMRKKGSDLANTLMRRGLKISATDPMSGFFMIRRTAFNEVVPELQKQGFKILADMLSASNQRWKILELPYTFRQRSAGVSKMDSAVTLEFLALFLARLSGGMVSIRLILFLMVGFSGVFVQLASVAVVLGLSALSFVAAQTIGVVVAMTSNFFLNNMLTYRDRALHGWYLLQGLLSFYVVCAIGAVANIGIAETLYQIYPGWALASVAGAIVGALWNFLASALVTWRAR